MNLVTPIDVLMQQAIITEVARYIRLAESCYHQEIPMLDVHFDLKGKAAGMYSIKQLSTKMAYCKQSDNAVATYRRIRFNPWLFAKYPEDSWRNTIAHEVAHYVTDCLFGMSSIRPHGKQWQQVMLDFEAEPRIYANYNLDGIPVRRVTRYQYRCQCRELALSSQRHQKIVRGLQRYRCRDCATELVLVAEQPVLV